MEKDEEGLGTDLDAATDSTDTDTPDCDGRTNRPEFSSDRAGGDDMDQDMSEHETLLMDTDDGDLGPAGEEWAPSKSVKQWTKITWDLIPGPVRNWIRKNEPSMWADWETMFAERRELFPVLTSFALQFKPEQRWESIRWLFKQRGVLPDVDACMFDDELCGFAEQFGKVDFRVDDDVNEVKYVLAVGDKFLSLMDGGGFSTAVRWDPLPRVVDPEDFRAGGLHKKQARSEWQKMDKEGPGVSKWVLHWVEHKVWYERLEPLKTDHSAVHSKCFDDHEKAEFMDGKIAEMVRVGAVVVLPEGQKPDVLTRLSLAPKAGSGDPWRVIMDMRPENSKYRSQKVKMEHLDHLPTILDPTDVMYSLDLKSAYYSVGVDERLGRTMGFTWRGKYYRFQVLPFGFKGSPHAFVKIGRNIVKKWRAQGPGDWHNRFAEAREESLRAGSKVMLYMDDSLGAHKYMAAAVWQRNAQMLELEALGFSLSAKGELLPFPAVKFLGMIVHLGRTVPSWHVPAEKLAAIETVSTELVEDMGEKGTVLCRKAAKCIGKMIAAARAVPIGKLLFRELNQCIYSNGRPEWGGSTRLSPQAMADLRFIIKCLGSYNRRGSPIWISSTVVPVDKLVIQDAGPRAVGYAVHTAPAELRAIDCSLDMLPVDTGLPTRWGGHVSMPSMPAVELATSIGTIELREDEAELAHVQKELLGVLLALRSRRRELQDKRVCIFVDSTSSVHYLVKWGGASIRLCRIVRAIWEVCVKWGIRLVQVSHIKGDAMISAGVDALSRPPKFARKCEADRDDWQLTGAAFEAVQAFSQQMFGGTITMDRMASRANRQVQRFSSVSSVDPDAESFSAFATDWAVSPTGEQEISYCFPPFSFIPRVLQHVQQCKAKAVIIVPEWPSQAWWVKMMQMSVGCAQFQGMTVFERVKDSRLQPVTKTISFRPLMVAIDGTVMPTLASEDRQSRGEGSTIKVRNSFREVL